MKLLWPSEVGATCATALLLVVALAGCTVWARSATPKPTLEPSLIDSSIMTGDPCLAPCWYGLAIGRSTKADILAVAGTLSFIDPNAFPEQGSSYLDPNTNQSVAATLVFLRCRAPGGGTCTALLLVKDVLKQVYLTPPPLLTLGEVVAKLGPPEYVHVMVAGGSGTECRTALVWKQRGISIEAAGAVGCDEMRRSGRPSRETLVFRITFESPEDLGAIPSPGADFPWLGFATP